MAARGPKIVLQPPRIPEGAEAQGTCPQAHWAGESAGCCLSGCLVTDEDAILSTQAIWASLIREQGTGQLRVPGDLKVHAKPVRTGPGEMTVLGRD